MPRRVIVIPDGGGRRDPRYAAESSSRNASSYPPSNPLSSTARRGRTGWEPNPYGEFPGDARASSMVNYNDRGYETRAEPFPSRSPMGRQYRDYKNISKKAETASRTYKDHRRALSPKIPSKREPISEADKRSHQELGKLACFAGTSYES